MSLAGLLAAVAEDPQLRYRPRQSSLTRRPGGERDLVAPSALRPLLSRRSRPGTVDRPGRPRPVRARGDRDRAGGRGPDGGAGRVPAAALGRHLPRLGDAAARAALAPLGHGRAADRRAAPPGTTRVAARATPVGGAAQGRSSRRSAPCCSRSWPGSATWSRSGCAVGDDADPEDVIARLVDIGYARVEMVSKRGELAVRGGLLDVFPPTEEHPLRIEFFGDTVEEIRVFKVADQRSAGNAEHGLWAPPCRELLLTPSVRARAKELAAKHPAVSEHPRQDRRRDHRRGHGGVLLGPRRPDGAAARPPAARRRGARLRPRADQDAGDRAGLDQPGVPRGVLGERRLAAARRRSTSAGRPSSRSRRSARPPPSLASRGGRWRRSASTEGVRRGPTAGQPDGQLADGVSALRSVSPSTPSPRRPIAARPAA